MVKDERINILKKRYNENWRVNGNVIGTYSCGFISWIPLVRVEQIIAVADLLMERYNDRKRITIGALDIKPDLSARSQEELLRVIYG